MAKSLTKEATRKAQLQAIGRVSVEWSILERILIQGIEHIAFGYPWHANVFTANFNVGILLKIFHSLLIGEHKAHPTMKKFSKIRNSIKDANTHRNKIIHGLWVGHHKRDTFGLIDFRKGNRLKVEIEPLTINDIEKIADNIREVGEKLDDFMKKYVYTIPSLRERLRKSDFH